ncbi:hypothetical protein B0J14DRAFT_568680 [Halenospora varia]|nr:hypothetical protein B0J14DRAFT_568680 [Halenospora varia]
MSAQDLAVPTSLASGSENTEASSDLSRSKEKKPASGWKHQKPQQKIVLHHPMPVPGGYGSPYFEGKEVTAFLKALNRYFKDYGVDDDKEKKERTAEYSATRIKRDIERLPEFKDSTQWDIFQEVLLREYRSNDSDQLLHTVGYLEKYVKDFKQLVEQGQVTQSQIHEYCRGFYEIGVKCIEKGNITDKALTFKFIYALPQNLKIKAMRSAAKGPKFDPDNMKSFQEVYRTIEGSCAVLKDMDDLLGYNICRNPEPDRPTAGTVPNTLPFIRARTRESSSRKITSKEIDDITEGLDKLQILQAVTERAMRKVTTANVNNTTYTDLSDWDRNTAEVNYGGFQGQSSYNGRSRRPFRDDDICKWCRNIQVDGMRPQPPHQYMNQCHDYKMFIGKGVIHEADETGRVCIGPWNPSKPAFPVQFSNDLPRRNQIIQRTINTIYSHIPERREQAIRENAEHERVARESRKPNVSSVESIEAFKDEEYDTTDLLEERELDEEQSAWVQEFIVNAVETRKSRRKAERDAPYTKETLQERLQKQGSYGRPKPTAGRTSNAKENSQEGRRGSSHDRRAS